MDYKEQIKKEMKEHGKVNMTLHLNEYIIPDIPEDHRAYIIDGYDTPEEVINVWRICPKESR